MNLPCLFIQHLPLNAYRGSADFHQLGHGNLDHLRNPKLVAALGEENVTMIAVAIHHVMALSKSGNVHVWGKYSSEETNESVDGVSLPKLLPEASKRGVIYIACGPSEVSTPSVLGLMAT